MILAFAAGKDFWDSGAIRAAVAEVREAARRLQKGVDVARESNRLAVAVRSIERAIALHSEPSILEPARAEALVSNLPTLGAVRLPFVLDEEDRGATGVFFSFAPYYPDPLLSSRVEVDGAKSAPKHSSRVDQIDESLQHELKLSRSIRLLGGTNGMVPLGNSRHIEITSALHKFLYAAAGETAFNVNFIYKDGSISGDVRLRQLPLRARPKTAVDLTAGLESCRHWDLDLGIDFYVLRNAEIARRDDADFGSQERAAYQRFYNLLNELDRSEGIHLRLYHTGLEPAVLGVYRAVVDLLLSGRNLVVTPIFTAGGKDQPGWW